MPTRDREAEHDDDAVWKALANPVRRKILDLLRARPLRTGEVADHFGDLSRFAVMQHLKILTEAQLVVPRRDGRARVNYLNPIPIQLIHERWVSRFQRPWAEALVALKEELEGRASGDPGA